MARVPWWHLPWRSQEWEVQSLSWGNSDQRDRNTVLKDSRASKPGADEKAKAGAQVPKRRSVQASAVWEKVPQGLSGKELKVPIL